MNKFKLGISACLLGEKVRYDGEHKRSPFCADQLSEFADFESFCPEVAAGMGVPRPTIHLLQTREGVRAVKTDDQDDDVTDGLRDAAVEYLSQRQDLDGYILMQRSPSCGQSHVKVMQPNGELEFVGQGIFAQELQKELPLLPVTQASFLEDREGRENFLLRVTVFQQLRQLLSQNDVSAKSLLDFHSRCKYLVMAHHGDSYKYLGRLLSNLKFKELNSFEKTLDEYAHILMKALMFTPDRGHHINVVQHMLGYLKHCLCPEEKAEIQQLMLAYHQEKRPLTALLNALKHQMARFPEQSAYLSIQVYLAVYSNPLNLA